MLAMRKRLGHGRTRVVRCKADTSETQKTSTTYARLYHWNLEALNILTCAKEETRPQRQVYLEWLGIINRPANIRSMPLATSLILKSRLQEQGLLRKRTL